MAVSSTSVKFFTLRMLVLQSRSSSSLEIVWQFRPAINMMSPAHHAQHTTMWSTQPCAAHGRARTPFCQIHHRPPCPPVQGGSAIFGTFCCTIWKHNIAELTSKQYHAHFYICMFFSRLLNFSGGLNWIWHISCDPPGQQGTDGILMNNQNQ